MTDKHESRAKERIRVGRRLREKRMSTVLRRLIGRIEGRIRLAELVGSFGDRTFGALLLIFALPNLIPLPPGSSAILGAPLILISTQLALGRTSLWLPQAVGNRTLASHDLQKLVGYTAPALRRTELLLAPRLDMFLNDRLIGFACLVLAIVLFLPIPLGNIPPAFAICAFALGLLQRDGAAVLVGWVGTAASLVIVALVSGVVIYTVKAAYDAFVSFFGG
jgi:hypothetical protein